jgi:hypothetical protein
MRFLPLSLLFLAAAQGSHNPQHTSNSNAPLCPPSLPGTPAATCLCAMGLPWSCTCANGQATCLCGNGRPPTAGMGCLVQYSPPGTPPPSPAQPPFPPLAPNGVILNALPALEVGFTIAPIAVSTGFTISNFSAALSALAQCASHDCAVDIDESLGMTWQSTASAVLTGVQARIAWQTINRTVLCPPPPPKPPGAVDLPPLMRQRRAPCGSVVQSPISTSESARAAREALSMSAAAVQSLLREVGLSSTFNLSAAPTVVRL